jgi:hypothetical protein
MNVRIIVTVILMALAGPLPAAVACPYCDTETGQQVRAGIFNDQFWSNVTVTVLPLLFLAGIVALIHFDLSTLWPPRHHRKDSFESE